MNDLLLRAARGERTERPPVWLMRQAGRHLPEYRDLRSEYTFREAISTPSVAAEITLQPWERYRPDAVVIFSDILVLLEALGVEFHIEAGVGPVIDNPVDDGTELARDGSSVRQTLHFVGELLELVDERVGDQVPVIGFAGGPFTLASYAVSGEPSRSHFPLRRLRAERPDQFRLLLETISDAIRDHLEFQIEAGADVVQLFDTYAGILTPADYREFIIPLHQEILGGLNAPTILFVRGMGGRLDQLGAADPDVVGLDWSVDIGFAREMLGDSPVQGNLDPSHLYGKPAFVRERTIEVIESAGAAGHILNLGHGVHKDTPVRAVETVIETAKSVSR